MATKTERAQALYAELIADNDPNIRKKFIQRCIDDLNMSAAGAATYYQNAKKRHETGASPVYGKQLKKQVSRANSVEINTDPWSIVTVLDDKVINCATFVGEQSARDAHAAMREAQRTNSEVVQGSVAVGSDYVLGA